MYFFACHLFSNNDDILIDDAMSLLRDMGTVRNMRKFIESKNKSMSIIHGKPQSIR